MFTTAKFAAAIVATTESVVRRFGPVVYCPAGAAWSPGALVRQPATFGLYAMGFGLVYCQGWRLGRTAKAVLWQQGFRR